MATGSARADRMAGRIRRTMRDRGIRPECERGILEAYRSAIAPRIVGPHALPSDSHPDFLHPGRTVLILLDDVGETDPRVLAVGALAETRAPELRADAQAARKALEGLETPALGWWNDLPSPVWRVPETSEGMDPETDSTLLERIVVAPPPVQRVTLAEALDVLRHAHLRPDRAERVRAVELAERVFCPVAPRIHEVLDRRFRWWLERVGRSLARE